MTAVEAGRLLGSHRALLPNRERAGHVKAKMLHKKGYAKLRLYPRAAVVEADFGDNDK